MTTKGSRPCESSDDHNSYFKRGNAGIPGGSMWRIHVPMQGTLAGSLVRQDLTCLGANKPMRHLPLSTHTATKEACSPRARAPGQEKPHDEKPELRSQSPRLLQLEKKSAQQWRPSTAINQSIIFLKRWNVCMFHTFMCVNIYIFFFIGKKF